MKEITIRISEKKLPFFMELIKQLSVEVVQTDNSIPDWQKEQVLLSKQEIKDGKAELKNWSSLKSELFEKYSVK